MSLDFGVNRMKVSAHAQRDHSPRQVRALLVTVAARAGVATGSKLGAALDHRASSTGSEALLQGAGGSGTHERHFCKGQWVILQESMVVREQFGIV